MFERTKEQMKKWAVKTVMSFEMNQKAEMSVIKLVIAVFLIAILAGALLPTAIDSLEAGKNLSGTWTPSETSTFGAIGILLIVAIIAGVASIAYKAFE